MRYANPFTVTGFSLIPTFWSHGVIQDSTMVTIKQFGYR